MREFETTGGTPALPIQESAVASLVERGTLLDEISDSLEVMNNLVYLLEVLPDNGPEVKAYCNLLGEYLDAVTVAAHRSLRLCGFQEGA